MTAEELQLFDMIDAARVENGCAPLEQDPSLTDGARSDADERAESGAVNSSGSSKTTAGGNSWTAQQAYNQMMTQSRSVVLNCNLDTLGVGRETARYCSRFNLFGICIGTWNTRVAWVADFS
ncbi:CAP domain-containing protein [Kribbella swartbergensis]